MPYRRPSASKASKKSKSKKNPVRKSSKTRSRKTKPHIELQNPLAGISLSELYRENKDKISPIVLLSGIFICIYIGLSLLSYSPTHASTLGVEQSQNIGGVLGGYIAHHLFALLGYGAWSIVALGGTLVRIGNFFNSEIVGVFTKSDFRHQNKLRIVFMCSVEISIGAQHRSESDLSDIL